MGETQRISQITLRYLKRIIAINVNNRSTSILLMQTYQKLQKL